MSTIIFACPKQCQIYGLVKIDKISAFPSEKCQKYLPVHHYFYLSRTGGQSVISIPAPSTNKISSEVSYKVTTVSSCIILVYDLFIIYEKNICLFQKLMIDEKKCYFFGRNKHMCDFCIDHSSCSRVHAALVWHKHLNRPFVVDLGSSK